MNSCFVSRFKINGVPILPPVMTPEVMAEVAEFRRRALEVERRLQEAKMAKTETPTAVTVEEEPFDSPPKVDRRNSFTLEAPSPGLAGNLPHFGSPVHLPTTTTTPSTLDCSDESPRPRLIRSNSYTLESPSPLLMKHIHNESLNIKMSTSMREIRPSDEPAKAHVKRLQFEGGPQPERKKSPKTGGKPKWVTTKKVATKSVTPVRKHKSPYESTSATKVRSVGKSGRKVVAAVAAREVAPVDSVLGTSLITPAASDCQLRIQQMQAEHNKRVAELMRRQEEEQLELQERFRRQQEELMTMLPADAAAALDEIHTSTPLPTSPNESTVDVQVEEDDHDDALPLQSFRKLNISAKQFSQNLTQSSIDNLSSSQTLLLSSDFEDSNELFKTANDINGNVQSESIRSYAETIKQTLQDRDLRELSHFELEPDSIQHRAASTINAHVRGYLTRRLFQTERVQKVIQVIRDTLLFILDLHHEATARQQIRSPADLQLKRTLLHQLTSACCQLHEIFFGLCVRKRMEIIRQDRENLRRKLENRPWTAGSERSIRSDSSSKSQKQRSFRQLQMCSLYSVNIEGTQETENGAEIEDDDQLTPPVEIQPRLIRPSPRSASPLGSSNNPLSSDHLSKAVVTRLVNQVKTATTQLRPKTTTGVAAFRNKHTREQRHF